MRLGRWVVLLLGVGLIESVIVPRYVGGAFRPQLLMVMAMYAAIRAPAGEALPVCWLTGLARDVLSCGPPGAYGLIYLVGGAVLLRVRPMVNARVVVVDAALGFVACLAVEAASVGSECVRLGMGPCASMAGALAATALATGLAAPICFRLLDRMRGWLGIWRHLSFGAL